MNPLAPERMQPLGPAVVRFQPGDRVRISLYGYDKTVRTVSHVLGSGPRAEVFFVGGSSASAKNLERV
jgi:hypothetical protein